MRFVRGTFLSLVALLAARSAFAWEKHYALTREALKNEPTLQREVPVVPIEDFLKRTFGPACTLENAKEAVFDGVGREFQFFYQSEVPSTMRAVWERGLNVLTLMPGDVPPNDPLRLGSRARALDVMATYVDEPDWKLDDDVPRLAKAGLKEAGSGTATRALRHFWTPNEEMMGTRLDQGQETDKRMQLYYELSQIAFEAGDDYWGYRFLSNSAHYLQDVTQPFHVQLIINNDMLDMMKAAHKLFCDVDRDLVQRNPDAGVARCQPDETLSSAIITSGWYVGTYHSLFEDFAFALVSENAFSTKQVMATETTDFTPLVWRSPKAELLDVASIVRQVQAQVVKLAPTTGQMAYETFGRHFVGNRRACEQALIDAGGKLSPGYIMGSRYYLGSALQASITQFRQRALLINLTNSLLRAAATWTRQLVQQATQKRSDAAKKEIQALRQKLADRCSATKLPQQANATPPPATRAAGANR